MKQTYFKNFLILGIFFTLAFISYAQDQPQHLQRKYQQLKTEFQRLKSEGYSVSDVVDLNRQIAQATQKKDYKKVEELLEKAEAALEEIQLSASHGSKKAELIQLPKATFTESPFGIAFGPVYRGQLFIPYIKELGVNHTYVNIRWADIEPQKGQFNWKLLDNFLKQIDEDTIALIRLKSSSRWATKVQDRTNTSSFPLSIESYYTFIYQVVKRCKGKVRYFENDWEADIKNQWAGTPEEYLKLLKTFHRAVKEADPNAKIIIGGHSGVFKNNSPGKSLFFDYLLKEAKDYFDIFDIHLYSDAYDIPYRVEWFRKRMEKYGYSKPIVSTEYGGPLPEQFPEFESFAKKYAKIINTTKYGDNNGKKLEAWEKLNRVRDSFAPSMLMFFKGASKKLEEKRHGINSRDLVQRTVIALSAGVEKLWYWDLTEVRHPTFGPHPMFGKLRLMDENLNKKYPTFFSYKLMAEKMNGIRSVEKIQTKNGKIYLFKMEKSGRKTLYILWERRDLFNGENEPATAFEFPFSGKKHRVTDVFGNQEIKEAKGEKFLIEVKGTPLYIELIDT